MNHAGGCQCGAVRYRVARLGAAYACHCGECRRQSASAFAVSVPVWRAEMDIAGTTAIWSRPAASGAISSCHFCSECGVRLFHLSSGSPDVATLKAGTLDDPAAIVVDAHLWVAHAAPWLPVPARAELHARQPENLPQWRRLRLPKPVRG